MVQFQHSHGRPPTVVESIKLAQQATLETREAKHEPRSFGEQRSTWKDQANQLLGSDGVRKMLRTVQSRKPTARHARANAAWFDETATAIVAKMEERGAVWQDHHIRAEAQRRMRYTSVRLERVPEAVNYLVEMVKDRSISLERPNPVQEPQQLRRASGESVYTVTRSTLFTSANVIAAERKLVDTAGHGGFRRITVEAIEEAIVASAGNGIALNAGQCALVTDMATSGAALQLAIAPAGSGKTTAMQVLATAWQKSGGMVLGLAPSAAAAAQLREQTQTTTETLTKLVWSLEHSPNELPEWAQAVSSDTLVMIDEAGMADTISLEKSVSWLIERGASVRLIGDDQQLSAIGSGGVLRDIQVTHGAIQLTELMRFRTRDGSLNQAEADASLALRAGNADGLGFYLDHERIHVGDATTVANNAFEAFLQDSHAGQNALMLAPTRELVAELNQRARQDRLISQALSEPVREIMLSDGNFASTGDTIITRLNNRRLRCSSTDFVKNGDRWTIVDINDDGQILARHNEHHHQVWLPKEYVAQSVELGYATTIHSAQGVTADVMHGIVTGSESRQQFYTMMSRGKYENHAWVQIIGEGDDADAIKPDGVSSITATDVLERILATDGAALSASTRLAHQSDPTLLLGDATLRYTDAVIAGAEHYLGPEQIAHIEAEVAELVPGIHDCPAWPTLRSHLVLIGAQGKDPVDAFKTALEEREIDDAVDVAALMTWRLNAFGHRAGPLPWLPSIPSSLAHDPTFGPYLAQRYALVKEHADTVRDSAYLNDERPQWLSSTARMPNPSTIADIEVWRAANRVDPADTRPTGPTQLGQVAAGYQQQLLRQIAYEASPALRKWEPRLRELSPAICEDSFAGELAERLAALKRQGIDAHQFAAQAAAEKPLPDDHAAAALWSRIAPTLDPAALAVVEASSPSVWQQPFEELVGNELAHSLSQDRLWTVLRDHIEDALDEEFELETLIPHWEANPSLPPMHALLSHIDVLMGGEPVASEDPANEDWEYSYPDEKYCVDVIANPPSWFTRLPALATVVDPYDWMPGEEPIDPETVAPDDLYDTDLDEPVSVVPNSEFEREDPTLHDLDFYALMRQTTTVEPTQSDLRRELERADAWRDSPVTRERLVEINAMTQEFFEQKLSHSWGQNYLVERFGADLSGHPLVRPGIAPAGWTSLVTTLRSRGVSDEEMLTAGVARMASTGRVIDQFRDRVMFPITVGEDIIGFVGRRNPADDSDKAGPKYLNTPATPLFAKGDQFFGTVRDNTTPVIVEGPMDAIAVTLGSKGQFSGLAPLGTALTDQQAALLAGCRTLIIATDADAAGNVAAECDYWQLAPYGHDPLRAHFAAGTDPADVLNTHGPTMLHAILASAAPMSDDMVQERITNLPAGQMEEEVAEIIAARPSARWETDITTVAGRLGCPQGRLRWLVAQAARRWNNNPREAAGTAIANSFATKQRLQLAAKQSKWVQLANRLDHRLTKQPDWHKLEALLQYAEDQGHNAEQALTIVASLKHHEEKLTMGVIAGISAGLQVKPPSRPCDPVSSPHEKYPQEERASSHSR